MNKIYARQINPEYQESPLFEDEGGFDRISVCGNRDYKERMQPVFRRVWKALEDGELCDALEDIQTGGYHSAWYRNATQAINDLLWPEKEKYSTRDIHALKTLVAKYANCRTSEEDELLCAVLSVVTGERWGYSCIRGCCQSEWNYAYYQLKDFPDGLDDFETYYFNTGSEWLVHDEEEAPEEPEDISGYSVYCVSWRNEDIRAEIAAAAGADPQDVILYAFDGYTQLANYKELR